MPPSVELSMLAVMTAEASLPALPRALRRRLRTSHEWRRWTAAWLGGSVLGIANGVTRELVYKDRVGDVEAHQLSAGSLIGLLAFYFWILERRWPIPTKRAALAIGAAWFALTALFEFGFGHWVDGKPWPELLEDYNLAEGRVWVLVLLWIGVGPLVVRALRSKRTAS